MSSPLAEAADAGEASDGDAGYPLGCNEPGWPPCCGADIDQTAIQGAWTIGLPRAVLLPVPSLSDGGYSLGFAPGAESISENVIWLGTRTYTPAVVQGCPARFTTNPPTYPCTTQTALRLGLADAGVVEFVTTAPLVALDAGTPLQLRLDRDEIRGSLESADLGAADVLSLSLPDSTPVLSVFNHRITETQPAKEFTVGELHFAIDSTPYCANPVGPQLRWCNFYFHADALRVTSPTETKRLLPGEAARFATDAGMLFVTHRAIVRKLESPNPEGSCAALGFDVYSFEVVALP